MNIKYLLKISWLNIKSKRMAALFGASGLFLATFVIILSFAISFGLDNIVSKEISRNASDRKITVAQSTNNLVKIDQNMVENISLMEGVESVEQIAQTAAKISYSGSSTDVVASAVTSGYFASAGILLPDGVELRSVENGEPNPLIINSALARVFDFNKVKDFLGQEVYVDLILNSQNSKSISEGNSSEKQMPVGKFRVVAVIDYADNPLLYLPHQVAVDNGLSYDSNIWPTVRSASQIELLRAKIENLGLETSGLGDTISEIKRFFIFIRAAIFLLAIIMLCIAGLSMISTGKADIASRKAEIAFQKAIGVNDKTVFLMLLVESFYLIVIGFVSALLAAIITGGIINIIFKQIADNSYYQYYPLFILPWSFVLCAVLSLAVFAIVISINAYSESKNISAKDSWTHG